MQNHEQLSDYRGIIIRPTYVSKHGTGRVCSTVQGYLFGDVWNPSIKQARAAIDRMVSRYDELSDHGRRQLAGLRLTQLVNQNPGFPVPEEQVCGWCGHVVEEGEELADDPRPVVGGGKKVCHLCAASWEMM